MLPRIWAGLGELPPTLFNRHDVIISVTGSNDVEQVGPWKLANEGFSGTFSILRSLPTDCSLFVYTAIYRGLCIAGCRRSCRVGAYDIVGDEVRTSSGPKRLVVWLPVSVNSSTNQASGQLVPILAREQWDRDATFPLRTKTLIPPLSAKLSGQPQSRDTSEPESPYC